MPFFDFFKKKKEGPSHCFGCGARPVPGLALSVCAGCHGCVCVRCRRGDICGACYRKQQLDLEDARQNAAQGQPQAEAEAPPKERAPPSQLPAAAQKQQGQRPAPPPQHRDPARPPAASRPQQPCERCSKHGGGPLLQCMTCQRHVCRSCADPSFVEPFRRCRLCPPPLGGEIAYVQAQMQADNEQRRFRERVGDGLLVHGSGGGRTSGADECAVCNADLSQAGQQDEALDATASSVSSAFGGGAASDELAHCHRCCRSICFGCSLDSASNCFRGELLCAGCAPRSIGCAGIAVPPYGSNPLMQHRGAAPQPKAPKGQKGQPADAEQLPDEHFESATFLPQHECVYIQDPLVAYAAIATANAGLLSLHADPQMTLAAVPADSPGAWAAAAPKRPPPPAPADSLRAVLDHCFAAEGQVLSRTLFGEAVRVALPPSAAGVAARRGGPLNGWALAADTTAVVRRTYFFETDATGATGHRRQTHLLRRQLVARHPAMAPIVDVSASHAVDRLLVTALLPAPDADATDLAKWLFNQYTPIPEKDLVLWALQLAEGLLFYHRAGTGSAAVTGALDAWGRTAEGTAGTDATRLRPIVHGNVQPANILIDRAGARVRLMLAESCPVVPRLPPQQPCESFRVSGYSRSQKLERCLGRALQTPEDLPSPPEQAAPAASAPADDSASSEASDDEGGYNDDLFDITTLVASPSRVLVPKREDAPSCIAGSPGLVNAAFIAPEVLAGARPTPASDIFGLGAVCFCLLALPEFALLPLSSAPTPLGSKLWTDVRLAAALREAVADNMPHYTPPMVDLVASMLRQQPQARPTAETVVRHLRQMLSLWRLTALD